MNIQHSSRSDRWFTPPWILEKVRVVLGGRIELDPASESEANKYVRAERFFTKEQDGLSQPWEADSIFLNPPGGKAGNESVSVMFWVKLMAELKWRAFGHAIFMGFSVEQLQSTQGRGCQSMMDFKFCVPKRRIRFLDETGQEQRSPSHSNVIVYVPGRIDSGNHFWDMFNDVGDIA